MRTPFRIVLFAACACVAAAQVPPTANGIYATLAGFNCGSFPSVTGAAAVLSFSYGTSGASRGMVTDISITKPFDSCTPRIFEAALSGTILHTASIVVLDSFGSKLLTIELTNVTINSVQDGDSASEAASERLTLGYQRIVITYVPSHVVGGWDTQRRVRI